MALKINQIGGLLGARLEGIDFSKTLNDGIFEQIADALYRHQVISIPATDMTVQQHAAIALFFGEPEHNATDQFGVDEEIPYLTVIDSDKGDRADSWHCDETFLEYPPIINFLHGKIIPQCGGDTAFRSTAAAYDALSDKMKTLVGDLTAVHDYGHLYELGWRSGMPLGPMVGDALVKGLIHSHPVVKTHPVTQRQWLSVNETYTRFIEGLPPLEAEAILTMLFKHMQKPEFSYRHQWQVGDLLIWDQQAVQHYAVVDYTERRLVHRISALKYASKYTGIKTA